MGARALPGWLHPAGGYIVYEPVIGWLLAVPWAWLAPATALFAARRLVPPAPGADGGGASGGGRRRAGRLADLAGRGDRDRGRRQLPGAADAVLGDDAVPRRRDAGAHAGGHASAGGSGIRASANDHRRGGWSPRPRSCWRWPPSARASRWASRASTGTSASTTRRCSIAWKKPSLSVSRGQGMSQPSQIPGLAAIKIFADGASVASMLEAARDPRIAGFTTNPTLMRKAGVSDYAAFAREVLAGISRQADLVRGVRRRHRRHAPAGARDRRLGRQRLREDPGHEHAGRAVDRPGPRAGGGRREAERHRDLHAGSGARDRPRAGGRAAVGDLGVRGAHRRHGPRPDPADAARRWRSAVLPTAASSFCGPARARCSTSCRRRRSAATSSRSRPTCWRSCPLIGKELAAFSLETVQMFHRDAAAAGYKL